MNTHLAPLALFAALTALAAGCASTPAPSRPEAATATNVAPKTPAEATASALVAPAPSLQLAANETQVARYTTIVAQPDEADSNPLAVIAKVHYPRQVVQTVGDAVRYLLLRTGYQLAPDASLDPAVTSVLALRLPDNQRVLGPFRVDVMLATLMGRPFRMEADPTTRQIRYSLLATPPAQAANSAATPTSTAANR